MKRRANKAQELLDELAHDYNTTFKELDNIICHMEAYENIINRCVIKRNTLHFALENPEGVFSGMNEQKYHDMTVQYEMLCELMKGVE